MKVSQPAYGRLPVWLAAIVSLLPAGQVTASDASHAAALSSITSGELYGHVAVLADDSYEGRSAGTRGGRAAALYIVSELEKTSLQPAGDGGGYYQAFDHRGTAMANLLVLRPGSDPVLRDEVIVVGAHYDHVGYGTPRTSFGPIGSIHNGADDNASGVSTLIETIEAMELAPPTRRSILFALWDGEEIGLLGSSHWVANPTLPLDNVRLMLNLDMVGRLREGRLEVLGARTGFGLRQLLSGQAEEPLWLDFASEYKSNSDHWPFFNKGIPAVVVHTGLHDDYHRPRDDAERINQNGMQTVGQFVLGTLIKAANVDRLPNFRPESRTESARNVAALMRPAPPPPPRIGIRWAVETRERPESATSSGALSAAEATRLGPPLPQGDNSAEFAASPLGQAILLTDVTPGSPADQAGLRRGDRIVALQGKPIVDAGVFHRALLAAAEPVRFSVEQRAGLRQQLSQGQTSTGTPEPLSVDEIGPLTVDIVVYPGGPPVRLGIVWREDDAEPGSVFLAHIVPGSPADDAGLKLFDRIYAIDGQPFADQAAFTAAVNERLDQGAPQIAFVVDSRGRVQETVVRLAPVAASGDLWRPARSAAE